MHVTSKSDWLSDQLCTKDFPYFLQNKALAISLEPGTIQKLSTVPSMLFWIIEKSYKTPQGGPKRGFNKDRGCGQEERDITLTIQRSPRHQCTTSGFLGHPRQALSLDDKLSRYTHNALVSGNL